MKQVFGFYRLVMRMYSSVLDDDDDYDITESSMVETRVNDEQTATTSEATAAQSREQMDDDDLDIDMEEDRDRSTGTGGEDESGDGVTSEGEKPGTSTPALVSADDGCG